MPPAPQHTHTHREEEDEDDDHDDDHDYDDEEEKVGKEEKKIGEPSTARGRGGARLLGPSRGSPAKGERGGCEGSRQALLSTSSSRLIAWGTRGTCFGGKVLLRVC